MNDASHPCVAVERENGRPECRIQLLDDSVQTKHREVAGSGVNQIAALSGRIHSVVIHVQLRRKFVPGKIPPLPPAKKQPFYVRDSSHGSCTNIVKEVVQ